MASDRDGLKKLTEYLNQTRRQATAAIDVLNEKIEEMNKENKTCMNLIEKLEKERDYYRDNYEQVKVENSTKWKLRERDEWKSLVENVQVDRNRLQETLNQLETDLEDSRHYSSVLKSDVDNLLVDNTRLQDLLKLAAEEKENYRVNMNTMNIGAGSGGGGGGGGGRGGGDEFTPSSSSRKRNGDLRVRIDAESTEFSVPFSPYVDLNGNELTYTQQTPISINRQLKSELRKTQVEMDQERKKLDLYTQEIDRLSKLKNANSQLRTNGDDTVSNHAPTPTTSSPYSYFFDVLNFFASTSPPQIENAKAMKV